MSREDFIDKYDDVNWSASYRVLFIDKLRDIYDDFESRTCENCKHRNDMSECEMLKQYEMVDGQTIEVLFDTYKYEDFGCALWEQKQ